MTSQIILEVEKFLNKYNIINKRALIAFSAGPDSCTLALALNNLKQKYNLELILAYFNHGWRKEAYDEELFTIDFSKKINAKYYIKKAPANIPKNEETARKLRYDFLLQAADEFNTDIVFLAHNKNDNIETLIYRIIKGTSTKGLSSIPEKRDIFYRPLLEIEKKDIYDYLKQNNQKYMIDNSNDDTKYKRNLIRKELLPIFEKINPNYLNNINNLIKNSINSKKIIEKSIENIKDVISVNNTINYKQYINLPIEYRYEILNDFLKDKLKHQDYKSINEIDNFIIKNTDSKTSINSIEFLKIKNNKIYIENSEISKDNDNFLTITNEGKYEFEGHILTIKKTKKEDRLFPNKNETSCYLNLDFPITLRHRKNGDVFSPYGFFGTMKLKKYLINEKIEQNIKNKLFLLCNNNEIIWIIGYKISENYKVKNNDCYKLSWEKLN